MTVVCRSFQEGICSNLFTPKSPGIIGLSTSGYIYYRAYLQVCVMQSFQENACIFQFPGLIYWFIVDGWSKTIKYYMDMLYSLSPTRNKSHAINRYTTFSLHPIVCQNPHFLCVRHKLSIIYAYIMKFKWHAVITRCDSLIADKIIDWSNFKILEKWTEK